MRPRARSRSRRRPFILARGTQSPTACTRPTPERCSSIVWFINHFTSRPGRHRHLDKTSPSSTHTTPSATKATRKAHKAGERCAFGARARHAGQRTHGETGDGNDANESMFHEPQKSVPKARNESKKNETNNAQITIKCTI